jgi:hypothetical protein
MLFHPWYPAMVLAVEVSNVVDLRLWKIARGGTDAADESLVKEKVDAVFEARSFVAKGGSSAQVIDMYRWRVAANTSRLQSGLATS